VCPVRFQQLGDGALGARGWCVGRRRGISSEQAQLRHCHDRCRPPGLLPLPCSRLLAPSSACVRSSFCTRFALTAHRMPHRSRRPWSGRACAFVFELPIASSRAIRNAKHWAVAALLIGRRKLCVVALPCNAKHGVAQPAYALGHCVFALESNRPVMHCGVATVCSREQQSDQALCCCCSALFIATPSILLAPCSWRGLLVRFRVSCCTLKIMQKGYCNTRRGAFSC
jgi:hypothetical protein